MRNLETRIEQLENLHGTLGPDGRDPGVVDMFRLVFESRGVPFDVEAVPPRITVRDYYACVAGLSSFLPDDAKREWERNEFDVRWKRLLASKGLDCKKYAMEERNAKP